MHAYSTTFNKNIYKIKYKSQYYIRQNTHISRSEVKNIFLDKQDKLPCLVLSSAISCRSSICPGRDRVQVVSPPLGWSPLSYFPVICVMITELYNMEGLRGGADCAFWPPS